MVKILFCFSYFETNVATTTINALLLRYITIHQYGTSWVVQMVKNPCQCRRCKRHGFDLSVKKIPWQRKWQPAPVFLPGKSHVQRSLVGYSPWVAKSRTQLSIHTCTFISRCIFKSQWTHLMQSQISDKNLKEYYKTNYMFYLT